ncbi:MAG: N-acetyltransferase [Longimicrobiales bacterium]
MEVRPVTSRTDRTRFIDLPWQIYAGDPHWVPPLRMAVRDVLDRDRHPLYAHADAECFLAWRNGGVVGRICAIVNHRHNEFHSERTGFFGLFESVDDDDVANALLSTAADWLRARGMERVRGPMNLSTNDELYSPGILIDGFDSPPSIMMAHTPRYYRGLVERAGFDKVKDLIAYWVDGPEPPARLVRMYERLQRMDGVNIRALDMKRLNEEIDRIQQVYNSAWERNWGFVPMTEAEIRHLAKELKPVVAPKLCALVYVGNEPVGFALALPDYNQALRHLTNGRLLPFGLLKLLWYRRRINAIRVLTLGLKPAFRQRGFDAAMITHIFLEAGKDDRARGECSWILEDNIEMRNGIERLGGRPSKTYRIYEMTL